MTDTQVTTPSLSAVRDLLLPALHSGYGSGAVVTTDIQPDWVNGCLVVSGHCAATKRSESFTIGMSEIYSGSYKSTFRKRLEDLVSLLRYGPVPMGAEQ